MRKVMAILFVEDDTNDNDVFERLEKTLKEGRIKGILGVEDTATID